MTEPKVLCCRPTRAAAESDTTTRAALAACGTSTVEFVGPRPGKAIDPLLTGRIVVIGDDLDLAGVVLRLLRTDRLGGVIVGYATGSATTVTTLWSLPTGAAALQLALTGDPDLIPLVRDDVGGVLIGSGSVSPVRGTVYVDEKKVLAGHAAGILIEPNDEKGLLATVVHRRILGFGKRSTSWPGRVVQIGTTPAEVVSDGRRHDRQMDRWTFYKHTEPLRLIRGAM